MLTPFKDSRLDKVIDITKPKTVEQLEEEKLASRDAAKRPPTNDPKDPKKPAGKQAVESPPITETLKLNFVPHCVSIRSGPLPTLSSLFDFFRHISSLDIEQRFGLVIDDKIFEEAHPEGDCVALDLAVGLGCEYFLVKGATKPERVNKLYAYS
jgi:hypothetical protein